MTTFESVYLDKCSKDKEIPIHIDLYKQLDSVYKWINEQKDVSYSRLD